MTVASRSASGGWHACAAELAGDLDTLVERLTARAVCDGPVFLGFDFPIGIPDRYARHAGITDFRAMLSRFGHDEWRDFFKPARVITEVSSKRPFFPAGAVKKGEVNRDRHARAVGVERYSDLLRDCEHGTANRNEASSLFWTLGGKQVGKAAIAGWEKLLVPLLTARADVALWPFDGALEDLFARAAIVLAEAYPGEFYHHLGIDPRRRAAGNSKRGKTVQGSRRLNADALLRGAERLGVRLSTTATAEIIDGFGSTRDGEDRFDALVGLLGMINVVAGNRAAGGALTPERERVEGWILGQARS